MTKLLTTPLTNITGGAMNEFARHIPHFVDRDGPAPRWEFSSQEELLSLQPLKRYAALPGFSHFALSDTAVLSISDDGFMWWVVGFIKSREGIDLPEWDRGKYLVSFDGGEPTVIPGASVRSTCGDRVELYDGRVAKKVSRTTAAA